MSNLTFPVAGTLGAMEMGATAGSFLFGILTLQVFNYYRQFPDDSRTLKSIVPRSRTYPVLHPVGKSPDHIYFWSVTTFNEPQTRLLIPPQALIVSVFFAAFVFALVQLFFSHRIFSLSGSLLLFLPCITLTVVRFVFDIMLMASFWKYPEGFVILRQKVYWIMIIANTTGPAADIAICMSMSYCLWKIRREGVQFNRTRKIVDTLMLWAVETTFVTSVCGILVPIMFRTRDDLVWGALYLVEPKLYTPNHPQIEISFTAFTDSTAGSASVTQTNLTPACPWYSESPDPGLTGWKDSSSKGLPSICRRPTFPVQMFRCCPLR
ncbi:hypothetical protein FB45DRAFT_1004637 [Roridomyces roridus]|uniref:DUF6534 domain-containing protein n=1 Tax=Roridomyces roridus TaxID=1738132 RepID=A0AAD7FMA3_9AGAR|nr:hypothetical protein FB45DRAFT_1004637 [Roridomyces roridus]